MAGVHDGVTLAPGTVPFPLLSSISKAGKESIYLLKLLCS
jgi:hypothetical protein